MSVVLAACSSPLPAPEPGDGETACALEFCVTYPGDWEPEVSDNFLSFSHPADPLTILASASGVDMRRVMSSNGKVWPAPPELVVRSFWELLEEAGVASLSDIEVLDDGSVRSQGSYEDGVLWHRLIPGDDDQGIGIEIRAPGRNWSEHADVFLEGLLPLDP